VSMCVCACACMCVCVYNVCVLMIVHLCVDCLVRRVCYIGSGAYACLVSM